MAAATATGAFIGRHRHRPSSPPCPPLEPAVEAAIHPPTFDDVPLVAVTEEGELTAGDTHHCRAIVAPIQAVHHDSNNDHIPDPSRPQADIDHSGHTRQIFVTHHQQIHLHPAPIVTHFESEPYHHSIRIFKGHGSRFDPIIGDHKHDAKCFLLRPHLAIHSPKSISHQFLSLANAPLADPCFHHVHKIESVPKLSGQHPTNDRDRLPMLPHGLVLTLPAQTRPSAASIDRAQRHDGDLDQTIQAAHLDGHRPCSLRPSSPPAANDTRLPAMSICSARRDSVRYHVFVAHPQTPLPPRPNRLSMQAARP